MATTARFLQHSSYDKRPYSESESSDSDTGSEVEETCIHEDDPLWQPSGHATPRHYKTVQKAPRKKHRPNEYTPQIIDKSPLHTALGTTPEDVKEAKWRVKLSNNSLWQQFEAVGTEMIIMKSGRRMFPPVIVSVKGLEPDSLYSVSLSMLQVDEYRYRYRQGEGWTKVGKGTTQCSFQTFTHPDSRNLGSHWMRRPISFKTLKLTNNPTSTDSSHIILHSMQKYQPCLKITCENTGEVEQHMFPECRFIAVTSYQNSQMTQLKIVNNPYARAFRATTSSPESSRAVSKTRSCSRSSSSASPHPQTNTSTSEEQDSDHSIDVTTIDDGDLLFTPQESAFGCPLNYWADENSLYNPTLITPPPMLEPGSSFSEPYLKQLAIEQWTWNSTVLSPIKRLDSGSSLDSTQTIDVENTNDVFV